VYILVELIWITADVIFLDDTTNHSLATCSNITIPYDARKLYIRDVQHVRFNNNNNNNTKGTSEVCQTFSGEDLFLNIPVITVHLQNL